MSSTNRRIALGSTSVTAEFDGTVVRAQGIRYARAERGQPPIAASDPTPQRSVACPQPAEAYTEELLGFDPLAHLPRDEDCQRLSVTAPVDIAPGDSVPVIVWIHGGGYRTGAGDSAAYDPAALVAGGPVVFVAVTYRLGALGFLRVDGGQDAHLGLLDVMEALRWVHANIGAFGGDPARVTLAGQSSGADLISKLMSLDETPDLVARVVLQSAPLGIATGREALDDALAEVGSDVLARIDGGDVEGGYALIDATARPFGLRAAMSSSAEYGRAPLLPADGAVAAVIAQASRFDVLIGYTDEEARFFLPMLRATDARLRVPIVGSLLSRIVVRLTSETVYGRANRRFARALARGGARVTRYVLHSTRDPIGAGHTVDIGLLFPVQGRADVPERPPREREDGAVVRDAWTEFAWTGRVARTPERARVLRIRSLR